MAHEKNHDYHILNPSIWPFIGSIAAFVMLFGAVVFFHSENPWMFITGFVGVLFVMYVWWSDTVKRKSSWRSYASSFDWFKIRLHSFYYVGSYVLSCVVLEFF